MNAFVSFLWEPYAGNDEQLGREITLLAGQTNAGNHRMLKLIAEFDDRKAWSGGGTVRSCPHWLNWKCGIVLGAAREKVRVAHCLKCLPRIDAAFASGELSYSKVRAMTRVATPENEDYLLHIARHSTASHIEKVVGKYQKVQRTMHDKAEADQEAARKLVYYQDDDGMWIIHAKLPAEEGSLVVKALEAVARPIQREKQEEVRYEMANPENEAYDEADVSAEIFSRSVEKEVPNHFQELLEHTRADALVTVAEHFLATSDKSGDFKALKGSERCQVVLHVGINTLRHNGGHSCASHEPCHLDQQPWIYPQTARRLACDASLVTALEDEQGNILNIGRRARTVPALIQRALALRDKTCRFPGCCESRYVDSHHIVHWADGGETSLENLVTLCRFHHRQLHKGCFSIDVAPSNASPAEPQLVFSTSSGARIETSLSPQFPPQAAATAHQVLAELAPAVTADTCVPHWRGEPCDYGMVIEALLQRDGEAIPNSWL